MTTPTVPSSPPKKRDIGAAEHDRADVIDGVNDMKRRRVEVDYDGSYYETVDGVETRRLEGNAFSSLTGPEDYADMSEDDPEQWSLQKLDSIFEEFERGKQPQAADANDVKQTSTISAPALKQPACQPPSDDRRNPIKPVFAAADAHAANIKSPAVFNAEGSLANLKTGPNVPHAIDANYSGQPQTATPTNSAGEYKKRCLQEVAKQDALLHLLFSGRHWKSISSTEKIQRVNEEWLAKARLCEQKMINSFRIDVSGVDFQPIAKGDVLVRQGELIRRLYVRTHPLSPKATVGEIERYRQEVTASMQLRQLMALKSWITDWEVQLTGNEVLDLRTAPSMTTPVYPREWVQIGEPSIDTASNSPGASGPTYQPLQQTKLQSLPGFDGQDSQHAGTIQDGYATLNSDMQDTMTDMTLQDNLLDILSLDPVQANPATSHVQPGIFDHPVEPVASLPYAPSVAQPLMYGSDNHTHPHSSSNLLADQFAYSSKYPLAPAPALLRPHSTTTALPLPSTGSSGTVNHTKLTRRGTRPKRRGAPRTRMFVTKPTSDMPLSARAQVDNEEVLREFPEHLSNFEVMQRFVRHPGSRLGGWPTGKMVDILVQHPNAKDTAGITDDEHRANVKRWVIKERDTCNNKQRKEAEIFADMNFTQDDLSALIPQIPIAQAYPPLTTPAHSQVPQPFQTPWNILPPIYPTGHTMANNMTDHPFQAQWPTIDPSTMNAIAASDAFTPDAWMVDIIGEPSSLAGGNFEIGDSGGLDTAGTMFDGDFSQSKN